MFLYFNLIVTIIKKRLFPLLGMCNLCMHKPTLVRDSFSHSVKTCLLVAVTVAASNWDIRYSDSILLKEANVSIDMHRKVGQSLICNAIITNISVSLKKHQILHEKMGHKYIIWGFKTGCCYSRETFHSGFTISFVIKITFILPVEP